MEMLSCPVPAVTSAQITVYAISFDLQNHTFLMQYGVQGSGVGTQIDQGNLPGALQTALENHCKARVEAVLGIANTTIATP
jgi:hypothetical protein